MSPEENCAFEVNSLMPYATTDLYDTYYWRNGRGKKEAALQVIDDLKAVIAGAFDRTQWLDVKAKERLVKKVQSIEPRVAFPDWIKDRTKLNQYYELSWTISTTIPTYLDVTTKILTLNWPREVKKLSEKFDRQTYWINPNLLNVNAWYHPLDNTITFPISYLDYPFFGDVSLPKSVVHGTFASTVGHEIFHGFDPMGILFDHDGQLVQELFSDEVVNTYQSKIQCIMEKYNSTTGKGALTISEDFADNSAMGIFIEGYKNSSIFHDDFLPSQDISKLQLLYVAFASPFCSEESEQYQALTANDVHSGNKYRVLITIQNDRNFGDIFKCKSGSTMNPVNKCSAFERN